MRSSMCRLCVGLLILCAAALESDVDQALGLDNTCEDGTEACSLSMLHLRSHESSDDIREPQHCAAGTQFDCMGMGTWTGERCCLQGRYTCTPGTQFDCMGNGKWTGKECCLQGQHSCAAGTQFDCMGNGVWSGETCCLQGHYRCTAGKQFDCMGNGIWTGKKCCLK